MTGNKDEDVYCIMLHVTLCMNLDITYIIYQELCQLWKIGKDRDQTECI